MASQERILLCCDLAYQTYRAAAAHSMLTARGVFTGGLYGFMMTFGKMVRETKATDVVFCQDRKPYLRSLEYQDYKMLRKSNQDQDLLAKHTESMVLILEVLEALGLPVWGVDGFESDDLIAHAVITYRHRYDQIFAATNDSDLYQLLWCKNFSFYTVDIKAVGKERAKLKELGLTPNQYMLMTAMTGTHNDIEGIPKHGPITAAKAIKDPALMRHFRAIYGDIIDRNLKLIELPHAKFPGDARIPKWVAPFKDRTLYRLLGRYDINTTKSMVDAFNQLKGNKG